LDFEELGIWLLQNNNHSWQKLHDFSPNRVREVQLGGGNYELLVDFNSEAGRWVGSYGGSYPGTFSEILADANPGTGFCEPFDPDGNSESATIDEEVAVDRETDGLWLYNSTGGTWTQLSAKNPVFMVRGDVFNDLYKTALVIDFATDGLWLYDGRFNTWWQMSGLSPDGAF